MQSNMALSQWAESLKRLKLDGLVLWLLEAGAPLMALGAQMMYATHPFIGGKESKAIAHMLEDDEEIQEFARVLRGERTV
jgi:hypothetical protein